MPVIPFRSQRRAFLAGVEQTGMWQGGQKVWAKPAAPTLLALTEAAVFSNFTVQQVSASRIVLSRPAGVRSYYSFNRTLPIGSRIIFNGDSTQRWWVRQASDAALGQNVGDVATAVQGPRSIDYRVGAGRPWFGFLVGASEPASTVTIANFRVAPS